MLRAQPVNARAYIRLLHDYWKHFLRFWLGLWSHCEAGERSLVDPTVFYSCLTIMLSECVY